MAQGGMERILLGCLFPLLAVLIFAVIKWPNLAAKGLVLAVFSAILASIAWGVKEFAASYHRRTQMLVLELLSDGKGRTRQEIASRLAGEDILFRVTSLHEDALSTLLLGKLLEVDNDVYRLTAAGRVEMSNRRIKRSK